MGDSECGRSRAGPHVCRGVELSRRPHPVPSPPSLCSSAARKRTSRDGASGAPVNKRKSLLMKPRHYSPSEACEDESEDLAEARDRADVPSPDTPAGRQMSCCFCLF